MLSMTSYQHPIRINPYRSKKREIRSDLRRTDGQTDRQTDGWHTSVSSRVTNTEAWSYKQNVYLQWRKVVAAYRRVYDLRHLQADRREPGSAPEPYAR